MRWGWTGYFALALLLGACGKDSSKLAKTVDPQVASNGKIKLSGNAGSVSGVAVASQAVLTVNNKETVLRLTGAGLRQRSVLIVTVDVYVLASYVDNPGGIDPSNALSSLKQSKNRLLVLTLLRDVTGDQMRDAFQSGLSANGMSASTDPVLAQLLSKLNVDLAEGAKVAILSQTSGSNNDTVSIFGPGSYTFNAVDLGFKLWKLWFGNPVDDQMAELAQNLMSIR